MKRVLSFVLALVLVLSMLPAATVSAVVYGNYIVEANSWDDLVGYLVSVSSPIEIKITKDINVTVDASDWGAVTKDYSFRALLPIRAHKAINLNGHTINIHFKNGHKTETPIRAIFDISDGAMLTVYGSGSILGSGDFSKYHTAYKQKFWPGATAFTVGNNGDLIVNGGTINGANKDNNVFGAVSVRGGGNLTVNGGILSCVNTMEKRSLYEGHEYYSKTAAITVDKDADMPDITINGGTIHSPDATNIRTPWIAQWEFYGLVANENIFYDYNRYISGFAGGWERITINSCYFQSGVAFRVPTEEDLNRVGNGADWLENNYPADAVQCVVPLYKKVDMVIPAADLKTCVAIAQAPKMSVAINGTEAAPNTGETIRLQYLPGGQVKVATTYGTKLPSFIKDLGGTVTAHSATWINGSKINVPAITPEVLSSVQSRNTYTRAMTADEVIKMEIWYMIKIPGFGSIESKRDTYQIYVAPTLISSASVTMPDAVVGQKVNIDTSKVITEGAGYNVSSMKWYRYNPNPSLDEDYYELMSSTDTFEAGKKYQFIIQLVAKDGYRFDANSEDITVNINGQTITESTSIHYSGYAANLNGMITPAEPAFTMQPTATMWGLSHSGTIIKYNRLIWETNFEPVKVDMIYNAGTDKHPNLKVMEVTTPYVDVPQTANYQYRLRAYYTDTEYVLSDIFTAVGNDHTCTLQQRLAKMATCTEPGWKFYYQCQTCKRYYADKEGTTPIRNLAAWKTGDGKVEAAGHKFSAASCTAPATCSECGITEGSKLPHKYSAATCTKVATCTVCGATSGTLGDHAFTITSCTKPMTCSICGTVVGDAPGHSWVDATCDTPKTCAICGATDGSSLGHSWVDATCTAPMTCSVCGATQGDPLDHSWDAATCTDPMTCSVCGATQGNPDGHDWEKATCTEPKFCSLCGITSGNPLGHSWDAATCTKPKTCSVCGATSGDPLGHSWTGTAPKTCTVCGATDGSSHTHTYTDGVDGTCNGCGVHREEVEERIVVHMFRMYNPNTGEHFYTGSTEERDNLIAVGWQYEGVGFTFPANTGLPVHRLFQPSTGEHLYTMDEAEKDKLMAEGWNYEGIAFNSAYDTEAVQHRLHNPNATVGAYHFTFSQVEMNNLIAAGWEYQGIGWYSCWK